MSEDEKNCKYCRNDSYPTRGFKLFPYTGETRNFFQAMYDKEFSKIMKTNYCCDIKRSEVIDEYRRYFPYKGLHRLEEEVEYILGIFSVHIKTQFSTLTQEELCLPGDEGLSELKKTVLLISRYSKTLEEKVDNIQAAYEREKDPERKKLLDGREMVKNS